MSPPNFPNPKGKGERENGKKLSAKEIIFVKSLAKGMTKKAAALAAYDTASPDKMANDALKRIKRKMPQILDRYGITEKYLAEKCLKPALELTNAQVELAKQHVAAGEGKLLRFEPQLTALDISLKLHGSYAPTKEEHAVTMTASLIAVGRQVIEVPTRESQHTLTA